MSRSSFSAVLVLGLWLTSSASWAHTRYWPTGVQVSTDVVRPFYYKLYQKTGFQYELNASVDFARVMLEGDYGWGSIHWQGKDKTTQIPSSYQSVGQYFRVGLNYNCLRDTPDRNAAFLGVRYAMGFFKDQLKSQVTYEGQYQDPKTVAVENGRLIDAQQDDVRARWFEAVAGVKVRVWEVLYIGCTLRYKFLLSIDRATSYLPYDILGWGFHDDEAFGINYYVSLRIPFVRDTLPNSSEQGGVSDR